LQASWLITSSPGGAIGGSAAEAEAEAVGAGVALSAAGRAASGVVGPHAVVRSAKRAGNAANERGQAEIMRSSWSCGDAA
jgi:hypothetical protein